ncbi:MAG: CpaF family protein [Actinobacteria bacterium]|nr:CpaF family protein [Actinomycetota bacterium]
MSSLAQISSRARQLLVKGSPDVDQAIQVAIDESYESNLLPANSVTNELSNQVKAQILGLGALEPLIGNPAIEEIWINSPDSVFISENGVTKPTEIVLSEIEVRQIVERMLRDSGRRLDKSEPFVDATLTDGSRLHVVIPEITRKHWAVNIRKFPSKVYSLEHLVQLGALSPDLADYLANQFLAGKNMLISGATQAGKTTVLCALLDCGAKRERLITIEETFEIRTNYADWVAMQARQSNLEGIGEISLRRLVREALRMRPTRLVIGEVRQAEALDLLIALNSGISGMCTIHANSAWEALQKLKLLPLLAGENIPAQFVDETVNRSIDLVVHCEATPDRRITQVLKANRENNQVSWQEVPL